MIDSDLQRHAGEFRRYLRNHQYELVDGGILFPKARAFAAGTYLHDVNGEDERADPNLLTDQGLMYMLSVGLNNGSKIATWYIALYSGNYTPAAGLTAASFPATATEITSPTEGYTEETRQAWVAGSPSNNTIDNLANKAAFTIATASNLVVNGAALVSESAKGAITGTLISATKFSAARTLYNTDVFNIAYRVQLSAS